MTGNDRSGKRVGVTSSLTLNDRLAATGGRPTGFDYMRPVLAFSVIAVHTVLLTHGGATSLGSLGWWYDRAGFIIVPMFFALSGFLVAGSLERSRTLVAFLGLRILRILPALAVEVFISALIIGPIFTSLPLSEYFASKTFFIYFVNMLGEPHYFLPGVFDGNLIKLVNGQLWTLPCELLCYLAISLFALGSTYISRNRLLIILVVCYAIQIASLLFRPTPFAGPTPTTIVLSFIVGVILYRHRHSIPYSPVWFAVAATLTVLLALTPFGVKLFAIPISYVTVYLGLANPSKSKLLQTGDYSYGIYLYGFPIQQALIATSPVFTHMLPHFIVASILTLLVAILSWRFVEAPLLRQKSVVKAMEEMALRLRLPRVFADLLRLNTNVERHRSLSPVMTVAGVRDT